jgi:ribosomal protein S19E (S16A)
MSRFSLVQLKEKEMNAFEKEGMIYRQNQVVFLTEEGKLLADRIAMDLMI